MPIFNYFDTFLTNQIEAETLEEIEAQAQEEFEQLEDTIDSWLFEKLVTCRVYMQLALIRLEGTQDGQKNKYDYYLNELDKYYFLATGKKWSQEQNSKATVKTIEIGRA